MYNLSFYFSDHPLNVRNLTLAVVKKDVMLTLIHYGYRTQFEFQIWCKSNIMYYSPHRFSSYIECYICSTTTKFHETGSITPSYRKRLYFFKIGNYTLSKYLCNVAPYVEVYQFFALWTFLFSLVLLYFLPFGYYPFPGFRPFSLF